VQVNLRRLHPQAYLPAPAHPGDAGLDLAAIDAVVIKPGERVVVGTGIALAIPKGYGGLVIPRSGHARRHGIALVNSPGLIDSGYRGEVQVVMINHGQKEVRFEAGDRIAQLLIVAVPQISWNEVDELVDSQRGEDGFGSTGR
jgi:dUTP pyrophosphatase